MAQSTTNLGKIHVFPSEALYNQFKDIIADNDLALLKDDGAYIVAALLEQNGYVKFSNGLILQWGVVTEEVTATLFPLAFTVACASVVMTAVSKSGGGGWTSPINTQNITTTSFALRTRSNWVDGDTARYIAVGY